MPPVSDLVRDSKLETYFLPECIEHVYYVSDLATGQRRVRREEYWKQDRHLGSGTYGRVWLEKCVKDTEVKLRAVKEIRKSLQPSRPIDYSRELEAIAKFSHQNVRSRTLNSPHSFDYSVF